MTDNDTQAAIQERLFPSESPAEEAPQNAEEVAETVAEDAPEVEPQEPAEAPEDDDIGGGEENVNVEGSEDLTLASALGIDEDRVIEAEDGGISVAVKVDGQTFNVPVADLVRDYQTQKHTTQKSQKDAEARREFEEFSNQATEATKQKYQQANQIASYLENQVMGEFNGINWQALEQEDPTQYLLKRQQFAEKAQALQQAQQVITQQQQQENDQQRQAYLEREMAQVLEANPQWQDREKMSQDFADIKDTLSGYGYSAQEMEGVTDHRQIAIIRDAMAYRSGLKAASVKLAKKVPKFQKPGQQRSEKDGANKARRKQRDAFKKSGSADDLQAILMDRLG